MYCNKLMELFLPHTYMNMTHQCICIYIYIYACMHMYLYICIFLNSYQEDIKYTYMCTNIQNIIYIYIINRYN